MQTKCRTMVQERFIAFPKRGTANIETEIPALCLSVEVKLVGLGRTLDLTRVRLFQITLNDVISVFPDRPQASLLHNGCNDSAAERVVPYNQAVQVDLGA